MIYRKQTIRHDPDAGRYGDCFRTCLACLMDLEPQDVPHFMDLNEYPYEDMGDLWACVDRWLIRYGLVRATFAIPAESVEPVLTMMRNHNPAVPYMLCGQSPRGTDHEVICQGGGIIHDPHPDGGGLVGPASNEYFWVSLLSIAGHHTLSKQSGEAA